MEGTQRCGKCAITFSRKHAAKTHERKCYNVIFNPQLTGSGIPATKVPPSSYQISTALRAFNQANITYKFRYHTSRTGINKKELLNLL